MEPPVVPDRDEARRWATEELAKAQYPQAQPSWLEQWWRDFLEWLSSFEGDGPGLGPNPAVPIIVALAVALIIVAVIVVRPRLNVRHKAHAADIYGAEHALDAAGYRKRAKTAADDGDWPAAVVDQFRAVVRSAEERDVIEARAGRTADEAATHLGSVFGAAQSELNKAAQIFDAVRYGDAGASRADHEQISRLDVRLLAMKPDFAGQSHAGLAVPQ